MKTKIQWLAVCAMTGAIAVAGCDSSRGGDDDDTETNEAGAAVDKDGGPSGNTQNGSNSMGAIDAGSGGGNGNTQAEGGAGNTQPEGGTGNTQPEGGMSGGDCAAKAKEACEYQKKCDPIEFALRWDKDMNQFCIPKRQAACEAGVEITPYRAVSEACDAWVHESCDNYRNFFYRVQDTNQKWVFGSPACEVRAKPKRGDKVENADCRSDYECKEGLFCKTPNDDDQLRGPGVEFICGKCTPQYGYDGANDYAGYTSDAAVIAYRPEACKEGYSLLRPYRVIGTTTPTASQIISFDYCIKPLAPVGKDKPCADRSNLQCANGLTCQAGVCKEPPAATIPTFATLDELCSTTVLCDKRLHLECKPVKNGSVTDTRCVPEAVAPLGGYCKNNAQNTVAKCSDYARCVDNTGQCVRRNVESEPCFADDITHGANDRGSCDPSVYPEVALVCRQDNGEVGPVCHKYQPKIMCSKEL